MSTTIKSKENRLRRLLSKRGYALGKSRKTGGYRIVDVRRNYIEAGERFDLSLDEVFIFANG